MRCQRTEWRVPPGPPTRAGEEGLECVQQAAMSHLRLAVWRVSQRREQRRSTNLVLQRAWLGAPSVESCCMCCAALLQPLRGRGGQQDGWRSVCRYRHGAGAAGELRPNRGGATLQRLVLLLPRRRRVCSRRPHPCPRQRHDHGRCRRRCRRGSRRGRRCHRCNRPQRAPARPLRAGSRSAARLAARPRKHSQAASHQLHPPLRCRQRWR